MPQMYTTHKMPQMYTTHKMPQMYITQTNTTDIHYIKDATLLPGQLIKSIISQTQNAPPSCPPLPLHTFKKKNERKKKGEP